MILLLESESIFLKSDFSGIHLWSGIRIHLIFLPWNRNPFTLWENRLWAQQWLIYSGYPVAVPPPNDPHSLY